MKNLMPTEAIILAGGLGTRLRSVVNDVPKPMASVNGRPFLEYLLDYWIVQGIQRFIISIGYMGEKIYEHFGNVYDGRRIDYIQEDIPLGTGGALRRALLEIEFTNETVILINGDTWFEVSMRQLFNDAVKNVMPLTIALKPMSLNDRYGGVAVEGNNLITQFGVETFNRCLINGGCYLFDKKTLRKVLNQYPEKFSFEQSFLVDFAKEKKISASIQDKEFLDIGIPEDYAKVSQIVTKFNK